MAKGIDTANHPNRKVGRVKQWVERNVVGEKGSALGNYESLPIIGPRITRRNQDAYYGRRKPNAR